MAASTPRVLVATLHAPAAYTPAQLEQAVAVQRAIGRGVLWLLEPPQAAADE